jgi:hypothetical protein
VAFTDYGVSGGSIAALLAVALTAVTLYLEFVLLPKSRLAKKFTVDATVAGTSQPPIADRAAVVGQRVIAITVEYNGRRYEAFCRTGLVPAGESQDIVDLDNFRLIVSKPAASTIQI